MYAQSGAMTHEELTNTIQIYSTIIKEGYSAHSWRDHPLHIQPPEIYSPDDPRTKDCLDWIFLISSLNFSFWSQKEGSEDESRRFGVEWRTGWGQDTTKVWTGYWSLVAAINRGTSLYLEFNSSN